jgi:hypothetical protein
MSDRELAILREVVSKRSPDLLPVVDVIGARQLSQDERERLWMLVAQELIEYGLDLADEHNDYGVNLEAVVDWIGHQ